MPIYEILYAEDVPHYGSKDIEAASADDALAKAKEIDPLSVTNEPDHQNAVCKRIVHIEDADGNLVAEDIPLDNCHLRYGGEEDRRLCDAAPALLETLRFIAGHARLAFSNYGPDECQSIANRNSSLHEIARRADRAIRKCEGRAS